MNKLLILSVLASLTACGGSFEEEQPEPITYIAQTCPNDPRDPADIPVTDLSPFAGTWYLCQLPPGETLPPKGL